jgi:hypothetical protein
MHEIESLFLFINKTIYKGRMDWMLFLSAEEEAEELTNPFIGFLHLQVNTRRLC